MFKNQKSEKKIILQKKKFLGIGEGGFGGWCWRQY